jgi:hypothetical protein
MMAGPSPGYRGLSQGEGRPATRDSTCSTTCWRRFWCSRSAIHTPLSSGSRLRSGLRPIAIDGSLRRRLPKTSFPPWLSAACCGGLSHNQCLRLKPSREARQNYVRRATSVIGKRSDELIFTAVHRRSPGAIVRASDAPQTSFGAAEIFARRRDRCSGRRPCPAGCPVRLAREVGPGVFS